MIAFLALFSGSNRTASSPDETSVPGRHEYSRGAMGVQARIIVCATDEGAADIAVAAAFDRIATLERAWSDYDESSELRLLESSARPGEWREVSPDLSLALVLSLRMATETSGAFDPTVGALTRLWRETRASGVPSDPSDLTAARARVGIVHLEVDPGRSRVRFRSPGVALDLGGIGKGLAADEALAVLAGHGFPSALVEIGGDLALGTAPPGRLGWRIGIGDPGRGETETLELAECGVATSGDAELFVVIEGVRHSHIIDSRRGEAVVGAGEITVVAPTCGEADAWATALSVDLGLRSRIEGREGYWVGVGSP